MRLDRKQTTRWAAATLCAVLVSACGSSDVAAPGNNAGGGGGGGGGGGTTQITGQQRLTGGSSTLGGCVLNSASAAYCWGDNTWGELGNGTSGNGMGMQSVDPVPVSGGYEYSSISQGGINACAITTAGATLCWGRGDGGELGTGQDYAAGEGSTTPVQTVGGPFALVSAGFGYACGLTAAGKAYCWGENALGQLGDSTTNDAFIPLAVSGGHTFTTIAAGNNVTCGVTATHGGYCWGYEGGGTVGNGTASPTAPATVPTPVAGGIEFTTISVGFSVACGLSTSGKAYCWGSEQPLGNGSSGSSDVPIAVSGGYAFSTISVGGDQACGLTEAGVAYCWGSNTSGDVGDGTATTRLSPVAVAGGHTFRGIVAGANTTCAAGTDGHTYCWGSMGYTGNVATSNVLVPTAIADGL